MIVVIGLVCLLFGCLFGMWIGLKAFAQQRDGINDELDRLRSNIREVAQQSPDGRMPPDVVIMWVHAIMHKYPPSPKWRSNKQV